LIAEHVAILVESWRRGIYEWRILDSHGTVILNSILYLHETTEVIAEYKRA
jgi:hypothetical protein